MNIVEALKSFGLSEYEAKALLALLSRGAMTAREIAEVSGIPRTSVYDVMNSLIAKGLVESFGKPAKFRSLSADEIISILSRRINETLDFVKRELPKTQAEVDIVRVYRGDSVLDKLKELTANAKRKIVVVLSYTPPEIGEILKTASCEVVLVSSNAKEFEGFESYEYKRKEEIVKWMEKHGKFCHGILIFDDEYVFAIFLNNVKIGILSEGRGVLEYTKILVTPLLEYLREV